MRWLVALLVVGCAPEIDLSRPEDAPLATILTPTDGAFVDAGRLQGLGRVSDAQDASERLFAVWSLGTGDEGAWEDVCSGFADAEGMTLCVADIRPEHTVVRLLVKDLAGFQGRAFADVVVRAVSAPVVTLEAPASVGPYYADVPVPLRAVIADDDDALASLDVAWSSSIAGRLEGPDVPDGDGVVAGAVRLPAGEHRVTVTVTDPGGLRSTDEVIIVVGPDNEAPTTRIDAPVAEGVVRLGDPVTLLGVVLDERTNQDDLLATWSSSVDGTLGTVVPDAFGHADLPDVVLSGGDHLITLDGLDDVGGQGTDTVLVHVDTPPLLVLDAPAEGAVIAGSSLMVDAAMVDQVSPGHALRLRVRSDRQGQVVDVAADADGEVHVAVPLAPGVHVLTFTAVDGYGLTNPVVRTVTIGG